ncbi:MAG: aspartate/glutamate racemase family protein [Bacteroidetes bacterium]|nr:aspartate/glutamate racemase family protein [Bacteroidota bacterium]
MIGSSPELTKLYGQDNLKVVVADSGLGGLSVAALLEKALRTKSYWKNIEIIFFNAHAKNGYGYNRMSSMEERARVFDSALFSMEQNFNPDVILIACNTLSAVYEFTEHKNKINSVVLGIIESGVNILTNFLNQTSDSSVIILGTSTTIKSHVHLNRLIARGFARGRIIEQVCPELETAIQNNPQGDEAKLLIEKYIAEAAQKVSFKNQTLAACLACTHYAYSRNIFDETLKAAFNQNASILNPNERMIDLVFEGATGFLHDPNIRVEVHSQVVFGENEIAGISNAVNPFSALTGNALMNFKLNPSLFSFEF